MKKVYGYIRVSDQKQVDGASLSEQERAIKEYTKRHNLFILEWFRETKTAAKKGRPEFSKMMGFLKSGKASGVIMHKIDRSTRNLHDWAALGDLIDNGIEVHFAHESLDLTERSGRLSADIQAVMASDYVRNLRQEAIKGLYGRLKQGIYPFRAPVGYLDNGRGKVKTVDEKYRHLIILLFELYVHHNHSILTLVPIMKKKGLRNWRDNPLGKSSISRILNNPFYMGLMKVRGTTFQGIHEPIISPRLFKQAQLKLEGRVRTGVPKHGYLYQGLIKCHLCGRSMIGEKQKGRVYYRCHKKGCPTKSIREDFAEATFTNFLKQIEISKNEQKMFSDIIEEQNFQSIENKEKIRKGLELQLKQLLQKEDKLLDAYFDNILEKEDYNQRKEAIKYDIAELNYQKEHIDEESGKMDKLVQDALELCKSPINMYYSGIREEKRLMVKMLVSNFVAEGKKLMILPEFPYSAFVKRGNLTLCEHNRGRTRTPLEYIIYTDKNTSPILPKPLNRNELEQLFHKIVRHSKSLSEKNPPQKPYELQKNHPSTQ